MIEVRDVHKAFGPTQALEGLDLVVERGEVVALLGPNGAGKTTLVRILTTLLRPEQGAASVAGFDTVRDAASLRQVIGLSGQFAAIDDLLTGRENLELIGSLHHFGRAEARRRAESVLERFSLREAADRLAKTYSGGTRRRLDLALSLIARPPVLVLDEPTIGLDPRTRVDVWLLIEELVAEGTTLLLTTQYMEEADRLAHRIAVIDHGRTITEGTSGQLKARVGGDTVELLVTDQTDFDRALAATAPLRDSTTTVDRKRRRVGLPAPGGVTTLMSALRRLDEAGVAVDDIGLRRPSLDDVFVALTGHAANGTGDGRYANPHWENGRPAGSAISAGRAATGHNGSGSTWRSTLSDIALVTIRDLRRVIRTPRVLYFSIAQPVVVALLFLCVLGGAVDTPGLSYVNYLIPGVAIQMTLFGATTAVAIAIDVQGGMIDRFRSLPIARPAVLTARTLTDLIRTTVALIVLFGVSMIFGFGFHNGLWLGVAAFILVLAFSFAMSWLLVLIGLVAKDPETAHLANMLPFPLVLVGSAYVPVETLPDWLQPFASNQPFSVVINAVRAMTQGGDVGHWLSLSIAWILAMLILFIPLSVSCYRKL
jgi:ABC-2 type transport system ATP-binding protein